MSEGEIQSYCDKIISEVASRNTKAEGSDKMHLERVWDAVLWRHPAVERLIQWGARERKDVAGCVDHLMHLAPKLPDTYM
jgi:hypothetical protein